MRILTFRFNLGSTLVALAAFGVIRSHAARAQAQASGGASTAGDPGTRGSFRGLGVARDGTIWASGTGGTVLRSVNGGNRWEARPIADAASFDLRDIEAVSQTTAYAMVAGSDTGRIYKTTDGGATWVRQYDDTRKGIFLDGLAFWDENRGVAFGDPLEGRFVVLRTENGGTTWTQVTGDALPPAGKGEAAFAASGTSILVGPNGRAWIGTGANQTTGMARVFGSADYGRTWHVVDTPVPSRTGGAGIFSLAFRDSLNGVAVGGNYSKPTADRPNVALTADGGRTWRLGDTTGATGYLSAVAYVPKVGPKALVGVGTSGAFSSVDGGLTWQRLNAVSYNAVAVGSSIVAVGDRGRVGAWPTVDAMRDAATPPLQRQPVAGE